MRTMAIYHHIPCYLTLMLIVALSGCTPPQLGDSEAALALEDIVAGTDASRLKAQTPVPQRRGVSYVIDGRSRSGDLYLSPQGALAGIVLLLHFDTSFHSRNWHHGDGLVWLVLAMAVGLCC